MSKVMCPWISKKSICHLVATLLRSFLLQSWWFLYRICMTIRSWQSSNLMWPWLWNDLDPQGQIIVSLLLMNRFLHSWKNMLNNSSTCDLENVLDRHLEKVIDRQGKLVEIFLNCHNFIYFQIWFILKQNNTYDKANMFNYWSMTLSLKKTFTVRSTYWILHKLSSII